MTPDLDSKVRELENWHDHFEWRYVADHYEPCRVLDFGCGYGYGDVYLARLGFRVVGYDPDQERIEVAHYLKSVQELNVQGKMVFTHDVIPKLDYGLVWMSHVLEHISLTEWGNIFRLIDWSYGDFLISVPLGHAYDTEGHVNYWEDASHLIVDLTKHSGLLWSGWVDHEHQVIKAVSG
jgi:SAM-dependent methyltransferase